MKRTELLYTFLVIFSLLPDRCPSAPLAVTNGLALWLAADQGITANSNGLVTAWADQSGQSHSASQPSSGSQPSLLSSQLNSLPVVHFSGAQFFSLAGQVLTSQTFTVIAVARDQRTDTNFRELISNWDSNSGNQGSSFFFGTTGLNPVRARLTDNFGGADQGQQGVGVVSNPSTFSILTGVSGAAAVAVYQNSTNIAWKASPLTPRDLSGPYVIGRQGSGTFDEYWRGDIAELLVFDRELSSSELNLVWTSLALKYAVNFAPPVIESVVPQGNAVLVSFVVGLPGNYSLQAINSLAGGQWSNIARFSGSLTVSNAIIADPVTNAAQRFYRLLVGP